MKIDRQLLQHEFKTWTSPNPWVGGWTVARMREAIDAHDRGFFLYSSAAAVKITQYAPIFGALRQRVEPSIGFARNIVGGSRGLDRLVRDEVAAQFSDESSSFPAWLFGDIVKSLALMGFCVLQHTYRPSADGAQLDIFTRPFPAAAVQWHDTKLLYQALTTEGPIDVHEDDPKWSVIGHGQLPHLNGAVRALGLEYADGGYAKRDRSAYSDAHGHPKPIGVMPPKMTVGSDEGKEFTETIEGLSEPGAGGAFMHGSEVKMLEASATTSDVFQQILDNVWTYVACALLGSDGTMSKDTGGVYTSPTFAGVKLEIIRSDVSALVKGVNKGHIRPWSEVNYGTQIKSRPALEIPLPDVQRDQRITSLTKRLIDFHSIVKAERDNTMVVDQARVDALAVMVVPEVDPPRLLPKPAEPPPAEPGGNPQP
ncbi:MAG: hypothetical protein IT372_42510 [Polyangiaceae bacterium]|nr:hypothetical protein [Polyangiaceae bacterium]